MPGTLALIGLAIQERGRPDADCIAVELDAWEVGNALEAADDMGLLGGVHRAATSSDSAGDSS